MGERQAGGTDVDRTTSRVDDTVEQAVAGEPTPATDADHEHRYGPEWPDLRERVWRRDGYACRRCGADDRTLQAHHIVPRSAGGPDHPDNLVTICRPCHGVMHPGNGAFDDVRDEAPLFPNRDAPAPVARMRDPDDQLCDRCGGERSDPTELLAWREPPTDTDGYTPDHLILCKPCAGLVLEASSACTREDLDGNHRFSVGELSARIEAATIRPSVWAPDAVAVRREPRTRRERLVDDTPLRFVWNSRAARWAVLVVVAYVAVMVGLSVL